MTQTFAPNPDFQKSAYIKSFEEYLKLSEEAKENPEIYWDKLAKENINWIKNYDKVLNTKNAPSYKWFENGKLNIADQCIDRNTLKNGEKIAIIAESESGKTRKISYNDLNKSVNKFANLLRDNLGIKKGDRVVLYMPMIPEAVFAMLACQRIGAIHVVVFGGFSSKVLSERIIDTGAKLIITADGSFRHGKPYLLKPTVDDALDLSGKDDINVLVVKNNNENINMNKSRDYDYAELIKNCSDEIKSEPMDSNDTSFILHTSGSTGKPKGVMHSTAGYILWAIYTVKAVFEVKKDSIFWCTADIGWITGHTYSVYGPLACGATIVLYDGVISYPDISRWWKIIEKHQVTQFYTAPTALRLLKKEGPNEPDNHNLSSLKVLGTVGEPIDPETWLWYHEKVGSSKCPVIDTWWQTETGGHMIAPLPGATKIIPGSATHPLPGISAEILDINGNPVKKNQQGYLCITKPWPSMMQSIWGDNDKYLQYFDFIEKENESIYFSGDGAYYDDNGNIFVTGRIDDVMNVSGHRVSSAEVESVLTKHEKIAEAAAIGKPDSITGESIVAFAVVNPDFCNDLPTKDELNQIIRKEIGPIVSIKEVVIVTGLPKTRSGKILRRILRSIAQNEQISHDLSTIENPDIINHIKKVYEQLL